MALARELVGYDRMVVGGVARPLLEPEQSARPAARPARVKRSARRAIALGLLGWLTVMGCALLLVNLNAQVLEETAAITSAREELARVEQQNRELQSKVVSAVSVAQIERWAVAHGMVRPVMVRSLSGDPTALAVVEPVPGAATVQAPQASGFWGVLKGHLSRVSKLVWEARLGR